MRRPPRRPLALTGRSRRLSSRNWAVGVSAGAIFLFAAIAVGKRALRHEVDRYVAREEREEAIDDASVLIAPGGVVTEEILYAAAEGYNFVVHPFDGPCRAAFGPLGEGGLDALKRESLLVDKGASRTLDGATKAGRHAWAVWNDTAKPTRVLIVFQDTRKR